LIQSPSLRVPKHVCQPNSASPATALFSKANHFSLSSSRDVRQVELPPDIHPLPESVNPYVSLSLFRREPIPPTHPHPFQFVYPFTLEPHVLTVESNRRATLAAHAARRDDLLRAREDEKQRRKREALRRIAPGFEPRAAPLVPVKTGPALDQQQQQWKEDGAGSAAVGQGGHPRDVMDDLVDRLAELESVTDSR
jgi:hypothetical protein